MRSPTLIPATSTACVALAAAAVFTACSPQSGGAQPDADFEGGVSFDAGPGDAGGPTLAACLAGAVSGGAPSACTQLVQCMEGSCQTDLTTCFGPGYATGTVAGDCAGFEVCAAKSGCTTAAGESCVEQASSTCQTCVQGLVTCAMTSCPTQFQTCETGLLSALGDAGLPPSRDAAADAVADASVEAGATDATADVASFDSTVDVKTDVDFTEASADASPPPEPTGIAVDPSGYVFVGSSDAIFVFSPVPALSLVQTVEAAPEGMANDAGSPILTPNGPQGLTLDGAGNLLVSNYYETAVNTGCYYDPPGSYGSDIAVYADHSGDAGAPSLTFSDLLIGNPASTTLPCAVGVAVKQGGGIFVATINGLEAFGLSGDLLATAGYPAFANPSGVAFDPVNDLVYVTDLNNGSIDQYAFSGSALTLTNTIDVNGGSSAPDGVAVDSSGNVYVGDSVHDVIDIFSMAGSQTGQVPSACTKFLAIDASGRLYASCVGGGITVYANQSGTWSSVAAIPQLP